MQSQAVERGVFLLREEEPLNKNYDELTLFLFLPITLPTYLWL